MRRVILAGAALLALMSAGAADAAVTVIGGGFAQSCSEAAFRGRSGMGDIRKCDRALAEEALNPHDRAATYVNRGVLRLRRRESGQAREDFDAAIAIEPSLGEAWVNRGAASVLDRRYYEAVADIDKGLELGVEEAEKAYYNRGLAYEGLDDARAAWLDYRKAAELKPDWDLPRQALERFTVTTR
jgi:tetratricopeptide (TPR) repeat protein